MAGKINTQLVIDGKNNTRAAFNEVNQSLNGMNKQLATAGAALKGFLSVELLRRAAVSYADLADQTKLIDARLRLATKSQEEFNTASSEVRRIANENGAAVGVTANLYARLSPVMREAGRSQAEIIKVTEAVAKSLRISGSSAAESAGAITQFAQAMGSGVLRGDEFNSIAEASPRLMQALADSLGVPTGALRDMAAAGELTSDIVADALLEQLPKLAKEAEQFGETYGTASQRLANAALDLVGAFDKLTGTSDRATKSMVSAADAISGIAANDEPLKNILELLEEIARLTPQGALIFGAKDATGIGQNKKGIEEENSQNEYRAALFELHTKEMKLLRAKDVADLKAAQKDMEKAVKKGASAQVAAEKKALADLKKIRDERLDIDRRYQEALTGLGGEGEASFGAANALKVNARQALANGDIAGAQAQAQAALQMLQDLAAAGENTFGFAGFIKELQGIELAANDLEQTNAEAKLQAIRDQMVTLKAESEKLKDMPVSVKVDDASIEAVRSQIQKLAELMGNTEIVIPVRVALPKAGEKDADGYAFVPNVPQFATGGQVRGPGTGTSDSIMARLSNGEYVIKAAAVRRLGSGYLDMLNNGMHVPRFADGGLVNAAMSAPGVTPGRDLGRVDLSVGGESFSFLAEGDQFDRLLRRTSLKIGRTHK